MKDIIDLEYLIRLDDDIEADSDVQSILGRDREIYSKVQAEGEDKRALLEGWLHHRREQEASATLPGSVFALLYRLMGYLMAGTGVLLGMSVTVSFLAYHGNRPVNVTLFISLFMLVPLIITILAAFAGLRRLWRGNRQTPGDFTTSIGAVLVSTIMFKGLPKLMQRLDWHLIGKSREIVSHSALIVKMRTQAFQGLFFWPFFILTSLFSIGFAAGSAGTTFFRVMVSDMAFGWQSTLLTSAQTVHRITSFLAWPWAGWFQSGSAFPSLEQIEGSRIILKDGISVLATGDLVSWWPFLCMGILCYALVPRLLITIGAILARNHTLSAFAFNTPAVNDLIARMRSPVLTVDVDDRPVSTASKESPIKQIDDDPEMTPVSTEPGQSAVLLVSPHVFSKDAVVSLCDEVERSMFYRVSETVEIDFDFQTDARLFESIDFKTIDQVILAQEVWQPPIRGILHYLSQLADILPDETGLTVFLTNDANLTDLIVPADNIDLDIWKKAVFQLGISQIGVKRFT